MPIHHQKSDSLEMDSDLPLSCRRGDLSRGGSLESRSSSSRSRSLTLDDESLQYLTHEEKDVILFFEETIDSLEHDFEEQVLCDSGVHCYSPRSLEGSTSSHSEPEDVIDLVQPGPAAGEPECLPVMAEAAGVGPVGEEDPAVLECDSQDAAAPAPSVPDSAAPEALQALRPPSPPVALPAPLRKERLCPSPAEHPKLPRSVPTPLVIAQKISEKLAGNEALSPTSPSKDGRPGEWRTLTAGAPRNGDRAAPRHAAPPAPKAQRFPSNISVTNSAGRDYNKTISKAAVSVQERKARVLANMSGASFLSVGDAEARAPKGELPEQRSGSPEQGTRGRGPPGPPREAEAARAAGRAGAQQSRGVQTERCPALANGFQSIHEVLRSEPSNFASAGKTVTFRPDPAVTGKLGRQNASKSLYEHRQPDCGQDARRRSGSLPRAVGFRPQGITVQFAGRGSTEEARREALRKLGLLKETL